MHIGFQELIIILVVIVLIFGAGKFPKIMENFADGINAFKKKIREEKKGTKKQPSSSQRSKKGKKK